MLKFIKFFRGYLYVRLTGYSPERFFNLCGNAGIILWKLHREETGYVFCISLRAFRRLKPMLRKSGTQIRILKRVGLPFLLFRYRKHRFFAIGILAAFLFLMVMSRFVWSVEISGNHQYSTQLLTKFLAEEQIGYGVRKREIDCENAEVLLRNHFSDITWVSVRLSGTKLYVAVQERLPAGNAEEESALVASDLVTEVAGEVTSVLVRRGTALVQAGDEVEAGTVVVSGMIPIQDDSGETVSYDLCAADADVTIHTTLPYEDHFSAKKQVREQIGKTKYGIGVLTEDGQLNLFWQQKAQTGRIRIYREICLGRDFYLPFTLVTERLCQYENNETDRTEAEIKRIAQEKLDNYIQKLEKNAIQILSNSVIIEKNATEVSVHGTLDAMVTVSRRTEIENTKTQEGTDKYGIDTTVVGHSD